MSSGICVVIVGLWRAAEFDFSLCIVYWRLGAAAKVYSESVKAVRGAYCHTICLIDSYCSPTSHLTSVHFDLTQGICDGYPLLPAIASTDRDCWCR
jgi:hypothetical protein